MADDIRYVVLSDMHVGQDQSVLTGLDGVTPACEMTAPMLTLLMDAIGQLLEQNRSDRSVTLFLMGDIMELAFADLNEAATVFEKFAGMWKRGDRLLFDKVIYFEAPYYLLTSLQSLIFPSIDPPTTTEQMEAQNFGWIDFFWSMLGHQGEVGDSVERVYDALPFPNKLKELVENLATGIVDSLDIGALKKWAAREVLESSSITISRRWATRAACSMEPSSRKRIRKRCKHTWPARCRSKWSPSWVDCPKTSRSSSATPTNRSRTCGTWQALRTGPRCTTPGGWAIDPASQILPLHGGATVLMNENLDTASIHFFTEHKNASDYRVKTSQAGASTPFSERIASLVNPDEAPCRDISTTAAGAVMRRFAVLANQVRIADEAADDR